MRIVSLLPSATEIVCELGLGGALVGVSHECDHPSAVRGLPQLTRSLVPAAATGGEIDAAVRDRVHRRQPLYALDADTLARLAPDLIVTQALCDVCAVAEEAVAAVVGRLRPAPRVVNLEPLRLADVLTAHREVAEAAGVPAAGAAATDRLRRRIDAVSARSGAVAHRPGVVILEWFDPPFTAGHWSPEIVHLAGGRELLGRTGEPSRTVAWDDVVVADPDVLVVSCCGFDLPRTRRELPTLAARPGFATLRCVREGRVILLDGNAYLSRPGPRLVDALEIVAHALHPQIHPLPPGLAAAEILGRSTR